MSVADIVYALCAVTSLACAGLLLRGFFASRIRLLLWSGICFSFLAINNILLVIDLTILPETDLSVIRSIPALMGILVLLYGFVWDNHNQL